MKRPNSTFSLMAILLAASCFTGLSAMQEIATIQQYHQMINQTRPSVILFYSPTCSVCKEFKPIYSQAAISFASKGNFLCVDATKLQFRDTITQMGVQEVPVIIYKEVGFKSKTEFTKMLTEFLGKPAKMKKVITKKQIKKTPSTKGPKTTKTNTPKSTTTRK